MPSYKRRGMKNRSKRSKRSKRAGVNKRSRRRGGRMRGGEPVNFMTDYNEQLAPTMTELYDNQTLMNQESMRKVSDSERSELKLKVNQNLKDQKNAKAELKQLKKQGVTDNASYLDGYDPYTPTSRGLLGGTVKGPAPGPDISVQDKNILLAQKEYSDTLARGKILSAMHEAIGNIDLDNDADVNLDEKNAQVASINAKSALESASVSQDRRNYMDNQADADERRARQEFEIVD